jgi:hypothetical protein
MIRQAIHIALFICFASAFPISTYSSDSINQESGVLAPDGKTVWYNGTLLGVEGKGWVNTESFYDRLPLKAKGMVTGAVWGLSHSSAGMQIRFRTDAKSIQVRWTLTNQSLSSPDSERPDPRHPLFLRKTPASETFHREKAIFCGRYLRS